MARRIETFTLCDVCGTEDNVTTWTILVTDATFKPGRQKKPRYVDLCTKHYHELYGKLDDVVEKHGRTTAHGGAGAELVTRDPARARAARRDTVGPAKPKSSKSSKSFDDVPLFDGTKPADESAKPADTPEPETGDTPEPDGSNDAAVIQFSGARA